MPSASGAPSCRPPDVPSRSYLQRIAEPVAGGTPVLFAAPRPPPEDSRPPAFAPAQALRGALATPPQARASDATSAPAASNSEASATAVARSPSASPDFTEPAVESAAAFASPPASSPAVSAADSARASASGKPGLAGPVDLGSVAAPAVPSGFEADASARSDLGLTLLPRPPGIDDPPRSEGSGGRIHIGAVEIRTTPPPAAAPPIPTASVDRSSAPSHVLGGPSTPVSRGYGWRYGLLQS